MRGIAPPLLICSDTWQPPSRALVVDRGEPGDYDFLQRAFELCHTLEAAPVILTVARTERWARRRQRDAQEAMAQLGWDADFDFIVGCEPRSAVTSVARWRRCSFVMMEPTSVAPWWRWLSGWDSSWLAELASSLTIMTFPAMRALDLSSEQNGRTNAQASSPVHDLSCKITDGKKLQTNSSIAAGRNSDRQPTEKSFDEVNSNGNPTK
jgi:hypothetical protein